MSAEPRSEFVILVYDFVKNCAVTYVTKSTIFSEKFALYEYS